ncbi:MAG: accessory factor UbiK family protein [Paracoccaceae bacterium]
MQTKSTLFDDLGRLATNAAGMAQGMKSEAETVFRGWVERWMAENNIVTRDEVDVLRDMAAKAREENETLAARVEALEAEIARMKGGV